MPNHVMLASGAVVAVSVAVATAIAIYESPELRRYADDVRRKIAFALHQMGDGINPAHREPLFNRPEDADGFLQSRGLAPSGEAGVEADEETRRRQREELLYWNSVRLENQEREQKGKELEQVKPAITRGTSFDDFLRQDDAGERGAFVYNTGADVGSGNEGLRHRSEGGRSFVYANPFADEHSIDAQEMDDMEASKNIAPTQDEMSDIYSATTKNYEDVPAARDTSATLVDVHSPPSVSQESSATLERELGQDEFVTAGQEDREEAYASIQAWAQNSSSNFYSPLPITPVAPVSEPEEISDGQLTPTDSISIIGSGEDLGNDAQSSRAGETGRYYDVMSESDGMATPASWSDIGSVISESDAPIPARN
ncbi:Fc.00g091060.m01.CDS01 [Cosmosporella sp. VM-42]